MTALDPNALLLSLSQTLSNDKGERERATTHLQTLEKESSGEFLVCLLQASTEELVPEAVRTAAILRLKHVIEARYDSVRQKMSSSASSIDDVAKNQLRNCIVNALVVSAKQPSVFVQLVEIAKVMVASDFPDNWPNLPSSLVAGLSPTLSHAHQLGALAMLRVVFRRAHYHQQSQVLSELVQHVLPLVRQLFEHDASRILDSNQDNKIEVLQRCHLMVKIFRHASHWPLAAPLCDPKMISSWFSLLMHVLSCDPTQLSVGPCRDMLLKTQKWVLVSTVPFLQLYGRPDLIDSSSSVREFAAFFSSSLSVQLLTAVMSVLERYGRDSTLCSRRMLQRLYTFLDAALKHAKLYAVIKPRLELVLVSCVLQTLCRDEDELNMFDHDPDEFIRRSLDEIEQFDDPRVNASNLLIDLVRVRTRDSLQPLLHLISSTLSSSGASISRREGVLSMLGCLSRLLCNVDTAELKEVALRLMEQQVVPLLSASEGVLRARAAWLCGQMASLSISASFLPRLTALLSDACLPVRVEAALAFARILKKRRSEAAPQLAPHLQQLFERYVALMDQGAGGATVVSAIETIISCFDASLVSPFASALTQRVISMVQRMLMPQPQQQLQHQTPQFGEFEVDSEGDEDPESMLVAFRVLCALVRCSSSSPSLYAHLEALCLPLLRDLVSIETLDLVDEAVDVLESLAAASPVPMSPALHSLLPHVASFATQTGGRDYLSVIMPFFRTVVARDTDTFYTSQGLQCLLQLCNFVMTSSDSENDGKFAAQLLECLLANGRPALVPHMQHMVGMTVTCLVPAVARMESDPEDPMFEFECCLLVNVFANAAIFNAEAFLNACQQLGCTQRVVGLMISMSARMEGGFAEIMLIALSRLLSVDWSTLGAAPLLTALLDALLRLCEQLRQEQLAEEAEEQHGEHRVETKKTRHVLVDVDTNEDHIDADELEHVRLMHRSISGDVAALLCDDDDDDLDESDEEYEMAEADEGLELPTASLDAFIEFSKSLAQFVGAEEWRRSLDAEKQQALHAALQIAASRLQQQQQQQK